MKFSLYQYFYMEQNVGHSEKFMHRILTAEMGWLRRLTGISRRQRKKNDDIRLELNQMDGYTGTKDTETQAAVVRSCKRMNNSRLPAKALELKHWYRVYKVGGDKTRGGLTTLKRIYSKEEVIYDRQQKVSKTGSSGRHYFVYAAPSSATYG